jgi:hypothetical protein
MPTAKTIHNKQQRQHRHSAQARSWRSSHRFSSSTTVFEAGANAKELIFASVDTRATICQGSQEANVKR